MILACIIFVIAVSSSLAWAINVVTGQKDDVYEQVGITKTHHAIFVVILWVMFYCLIN